jgi:nicotinamide mononucleotide transporter
MAIYGYWSWQQRNPSNNEHGTSPLSIVSWQLSFHLKACVVLTIIALGLGYIMANFTPAAFPYLDTFTTVFAVFSTYLVTQKVLENWLYWIVIDAISIYLYVEKDLIPTVVLFSLYTFIATWGYFKWRSLYTDNQITVEHSVNG